MVDVRKVEFVRAARLTKNHIELISFTVPRVKVSQTILLEVEISVNSVCGEES